LTKEKEDFVKTLEA